MRAERQLETIQRYKRIKEMLKEGKKLGEALAEVHMGAATYYAIKRNVPKRKQYRTKVKPSYEAVHIPPQKDEVISFTPEALARFIQTFKTGSAA